MMIFVRILSLFLSLMSCVCMAGPSTTILVMGDSLSAGYGIPVSKGWVNLLQQELAKDKSIQVVNASVSGETTSGGLTRLPALLSTHQPNVVILELGGNDGLRGQPLKLMHDNLQTMIQASQTANAQVLLIGMQIPTNYGQRYTNQFKETYTTLAQKNGIPLVPFLLADVALHPELIQNDGIHPTAEAQPILLKNVLPFLLPLIKK